MTVTIKLRGDTAANWDSVNPVLAVREMGLELDTKLFKVGDGIKAWQSLDYWGGSIRIVTSLPSSPNQGDQVILQVAPIFRATLSVSPLNGDTALQVNTPSIGDTTDTKTGHHIYLVDGEIRTYEGQVRDDGLSFYVFTTAQEWSTQGWTSGKTVEVGARDSLWTYIADHWVCDEIDYVENHLTTDKSTTSTTPAAMGLELNIIAPVNGCKVLAYADVTMFADGSSSTQQAARGRLYLDGANLRNLGLFSGNAITDMFLEVSGAKTAEVNSGNHLLDIYWERAASTVTVLCSVASGNGFAAAITAKLSGRIKA